MGADGEGVLIVDDLVDQRGRGIAQNVAIQVGRDHHIIALWLADHAVDH